MSDQTYILILRLLHIVFGILWAGSVLFFTLFIMPALKASGPDGVKFMQNPGESQDTRVAAMVSAIITIIAGFLLIWKLSGGFQPEWFQLMVCTHPYYRREHGPNCLSLLALLSTVQLPRVLTKSAGHGSTAGTPPTPEQQTELMLLRKKIFTARNILRTYYNCNCGDECFQIRRMNRKIIHIDMDAFFASVEQRDNPELRGVPVVVGGSPEGRGGVVAAASYEARKFGIRSAMPSKKAIQLCADVKFIKPRFEVYKEVSNSIRNIFRRYTDIIEPLSLDEAYLDVTDDKLNIGSAITIAENIRAAIKDELQLTASAGISINKFVAKIASAMKKPDGLTFIGPSKIEDFMDKLPVEKFYGVGKVTAEKMRNLGLLTGADVKKVRRKGTRFAFW